MLEKQDLLSTLPVIVHELEETGYSSKSIYMAPKENVSGQISFNIHRSSTLNSEKVTYTDSITINKSGPLEQILEQLGNYGTCTLQITPGNGMQIFIKKDDIIYRIILTFSVEEAGILPKDKNYQEIIKIFTKYGWKDARKTSLTD